MAKEALWREWIQIQDNYSPDVENGKAIGRALSNFETSLLAVDTSVRSIRAVLPTRNVQSARLNYARLAAVCNEEPTTGHASHTFFFINRYLLRGESDPGVEEGERLQVSAEALRLLASRYFLPPSFLFALCRFYLPQGRYFRRYQDAKSNSLWNQWYFLPIRVQVPCTDAKSSHAASATGSSQMNPFHYLHLPHEQVDIRGSQIAVYVAYDGRNDSITVVSFNFMHGQFPKIVEEPYHRMSEALEHPNVPSDPMYIHLVFLTTAIRWWNHALHSVNEQLIAYERQLQEELEPESAATLYNSTSKALHAMAAHVQRYRAEMNALEDIGSDVASAFATTHGSHSASLVGIEHVQSQLKATNAFVKEQEKKIQNILALLFNRMQIANDRIMVRNAQAMHEIMKATQSEAAFTREIALRSQQLSEAMKKDSVSMKTIALLTLFFLPATSFAALLEMPFFANNEYLQDVRRVWIWVVLSVSSTGIAYVFYILWRKHEEKPASRGEKDIEMGSDKTE